MLRIHMELGKMPQLAALWLFFSPSMTPELRLDFLQKFSMYILNIYLGIMEQTDNSPETLT